MQHRRPPLPECPEGANPFFWIFRTAPKVRQARRDITEREREALHHDRKEDLKPANGGR